MSVNGRTYVTHCYSLLDNIPPDQLNGLRLLGTYGPGKRQSRYDRRAKRVRQAEAQGEPQTGLGNDDF